MLQIFMASGCVSRMYCSISRMARLCRVKSPSFCRDTVEAASSGRHHAMPFPARYRHLCRITAQGPDRRGGLAAPAIKCASWPLGEPPAGDLGKDMKGNPGAERTGAWVQSSSPVDHRGASSPHHPASLRSQGLGHRARLPIKVGTNAPRDPGTHRKLRHL